MILFISLKVFSTDTLFFKLSNPWNTVKDPKGEYLRKCLKENNYLHVWDYNSKNVIVTESFYSDTNLGYRLLVKKYGGCHGGVFTFKPLN